MIALAVLASASLLLPARSTPFSDARPPAVFQRDATVTLEFARQSKIDAGCQALFGKPPAGMRTNACATGRRLIMPNPCSFPDSDTYAHLLCHELGHANGWPPTHGEIGDKPEPSVTQRAADTAKDGAPAPAQPQASVEATRPTRS
jgi:hypothetical protein